jgi:hypothetical protein
MPQHTFRKTAIALTAAVVTTFAGPAVTSPSASAATALADCTANLYPGLRSWSWTARCAAPHTVSIRTETWWYWLGSPGDIRHSAWTTSRQVVPGTPWSDRVSPLPEVFVLRMCMSAYQDSTLQIAPTICVGGQ